MKTLMFDNTVNGEGQSQAMHSTLVGRKQAKPSKRVTLQINGVMLLNFFLHISLTIYVYIYIFMYIDVYEKHYVSPIADGHYPTPLYCCLLLISYLCIFMYSYSNICVL